MRILKDIIERISGESGWRNTTLCARFFASILIGLYLLFPLPLKSQIPLYQEPWRWIHFTTAEGLPSNRVFDVLDVPSGLSWARTSKGIAYYNGYYWTTMDSTYGLPDALVENIVVDSSGIVSVLYWNRIVYQGDNYGFHKAEIRYQNKNLEPISIALFQNGKLIVVNVDRRLFLWDYTKAQCIPYDLLPVNDEIKKVRNTEAGNVWIETARNLYCIEEGRPVLKIGSPRLMMYVQNLTEDRRGEGMATLISPKEYFGIWRWSSGLKPEHLEEGKMHNTQSVALRSSSNPILVYSLGDVRTFMNGGWSSISPLPREMTNIIFLRYRRNGDLWVGTESGLNLFRQSFSLWTTRTLPSSRPNIVSEILLARDGSLWGGTDSGLVVYKPTGEKQFYTTILGQPLLTLTGLAEDKDGNIWVSSGSSFVGAYCWNGTVWKYYGAAEGLPSHIHRIMKDRKGRLWFLGISKIVEIPDDEQGAFLLDDGKFIRWGVNQGLKNGRIYSFAEGIDGSYWFGTIGGISCWKDGAWSYWTIENGLHSNRVFTIAIDSSNTVWFAHQIFGMGYFVNSVPKYVSPTKELVADQIWDIRVDSLNRIWASTTSGVICNERGVWSCFGENVGLTTLRLWPILPTRDKVYLGSHGGGIAIMNLDYYDVVPPIVKIARSVIEKNSAFVRWAPYSFWNEVSSSYIETRYKIDTATWSEWSTQREQVLLNLSPGTHIFTVQAKGVFGKTIPMGTSVTMTVEPPYYLQSRYLIPVLTLTGGVILLGLMFVFRKRKHNRELQLSEARYRGIIREQTDLICRFTPDGTLQFMNDAFRRFYDISGKEPIGHHYSIYMSQQHQHEFAEHLSASRQLSATSPVTTFLQGSGQEGGSLRWYEWNDCALLDEFGAILEVQSVGRDISDRKYAEEALRESEREYRSLFENAHDAIIIFRPEDEIILEANERACQIYGFDRSEFIGLSLASISENVAMGKQRIHETIFKGFQHQFESVQYRKDGSRIYVEINASVINYHNQIAILTINHDITERKKAELAIIHREAILEAISFAGHQFTLPGTIEEKIQPVLARLGIAVGVSRVYVFENEGEEPGTIITTQRYEWVATGIVPQFENPDLQSMPYEASGFSRWVNLLKSGFPVYGHIADFPVEEQAILMAQNILSIMIMPIMIDNRWWGFIGFDECSQKRQWTSAEIDALSTAASMLGAVIERETREKTVTMLAQAIKSISECVSITDSDNRLLFVNTAFCQTYGYSSEELIGNNISLVACAELSVPVETIRSTTLQGTWQGELINRKKDGTLFPIHLSTSLVRDERGKPIALIGVAKDITEYRQTEKELREKASLLAITTDAIIVEDMNHTIMYWNAGAERLYGWSVAEVIGKNTRMILHKDDMARTAQIGSALQSRGEWRGELQQQAKNGSEIIVDSRYTIVRDIHASPISILIVNTDITEKKAMEEQILRSQRLESIGTLAGGIAHDLNNVLAPILLAIEVLRRRIPDENSRAVLTTLETSAQRGKDIIKQVLTFARGVRGDRVVLQPERLIHEMEHIIKETFPKSIVLTTRIPGNIWTISGDRTQLHQVLLNMCLNARDAMPDGGTLTLAVGNKVLDDQHQRIHFNAKPGAYVCFTITDTGTGIPTEMIDKIFDPFFTTKEVGKGTGLGLSTAHAIIKGHDGFITVSSTNQGTTFTIYLPVTYDAQIEEKNDLPREILRGNGELILVVDDEEAIRDIARSALEASGYRIMTAENGTDALAVYLQHRSEIALVITDILMPFMDGISLIRSLREIDPAIKIIAASGQQADSQFLVAGGVKAEAFLSKPFTAESLLAIIYSLLHDQHQ